MKTIFFSAIYLLVNASFAFGQQQTDGLMAQISVVEAAAPSDAYFSRDNEPFFPGGTAALRAYLKQSDSYPRQARAAQLEGTVRIRFRVQPTGYLTDIEVVESVGPVLNRAASSVVGQMPRWYPAHRNGEAVAHTVILPITFRLE
jgi:periplasmic protein TonB